MAKNETNHADTKNNTSQEIGIRPPVVTIMGHVDHGKTSILDAIRKTNVQAREFGGITQHIGAYQITHNNHKITFIDTPGHAAFTQMRSRGGKAADIVVLVVAATEGVMPQTKEAISHAKASGAQIIVALNKIDLPDANVKKVVQDLASEDVILEEWGGHVVGVKVSAKTGEGINALLDAILATAELAKLKGDPKGELEAIIVEARLDKKKGVVVSCIIKNGTLKVTNQVTASGLKAKIRSLMDAQGTLLSEAGPSTPVEVLGFSQVPHVGDLIVTEGSELAELSEDTNVVEIVGKNAKKTVSLVLKSDTQGTLEAVKGSLANLITSSVEATYAIKFLHCATGDITESDVSLAQSAKGFVIGFDVKLPNEVAEYAELRKVPVKTYKTIYELTADAQNVLEGTATDAEAKIKGRAQVLKLFKLESGDVIIGCRVIAGALKDTSKVSFYEKDPANVTQDDVPLYTGDVKKLKKGKDEVAVVGRDNECGVLLKPPFAGVKVGLWLEVR